MRGGELCWAFLVLGLCVGCREQRTYDAKVKIERVDSAHPTHSIDIEFEWESCPGRQIEVIRGGKDFAACVGKLTPGDSVAVKVAWHWEKRESSYDWDIVELGGCKRPFEEQDDASFDEVHVCTDVVQHGEVVGFQCDKSPNAELLSKCPWFRRR